ncbi:MAG TPA: penicillin-binding transpeptidase domain-containing protein [Longimicrobiaceae bacterium]|nr:penicillin-binding transpeptidase domain-containing protein [Longimicrobiaceae bacterium]
MKKRRAGGEFAGNQRERLTGRRRLLLAALAVAAALIIGRAFQLQALEGPEWEALALAQQRERVPLPARRGTIYDRDGVPLAVSYETYRVSVAPRELSRPEAAADRLQEVLGLSNTLTNKLTSRGDPWIVLPGRYTVEQRQRLGDVRGVYFERRLERFYPQGQVGREVIGVVTADGRALGGAEQQFDELLRGQPGYSVLRRSARGEAQTTISLPVVPPVAGADVHLTIDMSVQEIADAALRASIDSTGASGGDLLVVDPLTGEVLAAVSRRNGRGRTLSAVTEPYEPGSTLKPFTAAALLALDRVSWSDSVHGEEGAWRTNGRVLHDTHAHGWMGLDDVLRLSSNIGIAKFAEQFGPGEQYSFLRDFGFGTPTGVAYPAESAGRLRQPAEWTPMSPASLAMGYEISVTPLQLAMGYGALANGGILMEPHLLSEIRGSDGELIRSVEPQPLRRVIPRTVAKQLTEVLVSVVADGTATQASLGRFKVAGKTGTSRRTGEDGRYVSGSYTATFVSCFPASDPELVVFVKLDEPEGTYYGGTTAAPVTRETLEGILAARAPRLHGPSLLASRIPSNTVRLAATSEPAPPAGQVSGPFVFILDNEIERAPESGRVVPVEVPTLADLTMRDAARRLHDLGLHVRIEGSGDVVRVEPSEGTVLLPYDTVQLIGARQ